MSQPVDGVDARTDRAAQAAIGVALLAAFVFRVTWVVPFLAVVLAVGAIGGPDANALHLAFRRWVAPRLPAPGTTGAEDTVSAATVRVQDALAAGLLSVAFLAFLLGVGVIGWALVIAEAVVAIIAATTRIHAADRLRRGL